MLYAQFYQPPVSGPWNDYSTDPIEACGDRAVVILGGRHNLPDNAQIAERTAIERGYVGYSISKGQTFTRSAVVKPYTSITADV